MMLTRRHLLTGTAAALTLTACGTGTEPEGSPTPAASTPAETSTPSGSATPSESATPTPTPSEPAELGKVSELVDGLTTPWGLIALSDTTLLVSERDTGKILRISDGDPVTVTTVPGVQPSSEGGLLGIALSPDEEHLYCYHSSSQDNRLVRYAWNGSKLTDDTVLLDQIPTAPNHNGGRLQFGPDGHLYLSTGDASDRSTAQDTDALTGKILRLTEDGKPASGNPFDNEVWSYGHRNVQGLAFDDEDRLWASEFGDKYQDELNLITKGGNYGWPEIEGDETTMEGRIGPKLTWPTDDASPSGLAHGGLSLWVAALRGTRLWQVPLKDGKLGKPKAHLNGKYGRLRTVVALDDALLVTTSNTDGRATPASGDDRILRIPFD